MPYSRLRRISALFSLINLRIGRAVSWLVLAMVLVIVYDVSMRYLFQIGSVALQELEWHMFALLFLLGGAYTYREDGHVRVDIFYQSRRVSDAGRAWINIFGSLFFLLPVCLLIINSTWPFVNNSFLIGEGSPDPGGLPYRFLLKLMIPMGFFLLLLQGIAVLIDNSLFLLAAHTSQDQAESRQDPAHGEDV